MHVGPSNVLDFEANWDEALLVCVNHQITELILGGDLFQSRSSQTLDVLLSVRKCLNKAKCLGISVSLANGNHDKVNQDSIEGYCHVFAEYENVRVIDECVTIPLSSKSELHVIPYFPETGKFLEIYKSLVDRINPSKINVLYLHAGINGALLHPSEKDLPANMFSDFFKVVVGHYHNRCHIPKSNVHYIGSSRQHNFGEDEEKGYTILHSNGSIEYIDNQVNTRYKTIDTTFRRWKHPNLLSELNQYRDSARYKVRLRIECKQEEASLVDKKMLLEAGANKVEVKVTDMRVLETESSSIYQKFDSRQIAQSYSDFCNEKGIADATLGVEYLSKIN